MGQGEALDCAGGSRLPGRAGLRPGAHRRHRAQLGRLPDDGDAHAVPRALGGGRRRRALLRLHRLRQSDPAVREDLRWWDRENTGDLVKDRAQLEYYSPINHLDRIEAPLLLLAGELRPALPAAADPRGGADAARERGKLCEVRRLPRRGARDQRPRAPHRLRRAHGGVHPRARRRADGRSRSRGNGLRATPPGKGQWCV